MLKWAAEDFSNREIEERQSGWVFGIEPSGNPRLAAAAVGLEHRVACKRICSINHLWLPRIHP
jgi:hypothetical protein